MRVSSKTSDSYKPYNPYDDPKHVVRQPFEGKKEEKLAGAYKLRTRATRICVSLRTAQSGRISSDSSGARRLSQAAIASLPIL